MVRLKRSSRILEKAQRRLDGVQSIDDKIDLGAGITAANYGKNIEELRQKITAYNKALSHVDMLQNEVNDTERLLAEYSDRVLLGVAARYGKDSAEYEMAGGVRKSDRKRSGRRVAAATS
jgi:hypothetical protein